MILLFVKVLAISMSMPIALNALKNPSLFEIRVNTITTFFPLASWAICK